MSMTSRDAATPTRRQRGREATTLEIKAAALDELRTHGARGVTMRGVARAIDMTPSGLYRYFQDHADLLAALCVDAHESLAAALDDVRAATSDQDRAVAWFQGSLALRAWALANVDEYGLVFGPPVWGASGPHPSVSEAAARLMAIATELVSQAVLAEELVPRDAEGAPSPAADPAQQVATDVRAVAVGGVAALVGMVSLEAFGHLGGEESAREDAFRSYSLQVMLGMGFRSPAVVAQQPALPAR